MKERFLLSVHQETWNEDALEAGDTDDRDTLRDREPADLSDVVRELRTCSELSQSPVRPDTCAHVWASRYEDHVFTGDHIVESVHVRMLDGSDVPARIMWRILRLAGHA